MATPETSSELLSDIAMLSSKALAGTITDEELMHGLKLLREGRLSITPSRKAKVDGDSELASLL